MKTFVILIVGIALTSTACRGDHPANAGRDTARQHYNVHSTLDTSKINTPGGDAGLDNGGSGGTRIAKDTTPIKNNKK
ncbi:hypothetical protein BEL04_16995 [Mucilaginibacter sp. PPCGB 2223]|uniref:hypothetical protein n=1 Tax=Mucilaginibacter sp. PPCGB 2223 TaxID=1886027 RepID=UPI00082539B9|nr:hypothetical protein [Mucilaginibacter sp. PPCGB 2223]OCX51712.1 hypothetical protein BEL04_16995 [Mucilaginibacter sp. PPCGB 2223]